jgi:type 1 glutamine amidotransferase
MDAGAETAPSVDAPATTDANPGGGGGIANTRKGVLLYTYRTGFRHTSAVPASLLLKDKLTALGYDVQIEDADNNLFTDENLTKYRLVVLVQSSGEPMGTGTTEAAALIKFVRDGGGLAGFHAAAIVRPYPPTHPYVGLLGGQFTGHPGGLRKATCTPVAGASHPAIAHITAPFQQTDEIFTFTAMNPGNQVILNCADPNGAPLPITWYRNEGAGRVFYTGLGHGDELWTADSTFVNDHFFPGLLWTIGR